jgi:hypothetical protein
MLFVVEVNIRSCSLTIIEAYLLVFIHLLILFNSLLQ